MKTRPYIGQRVVINDNGLDTLPKLSREEMRSALEVRTVVEVGEEVCVGLWAVDLDGPLQKFLLTSDDIDPVE